MNKPKKKPPEGGTQSLYDGAAQQRIPLEVIEGSERFETAHLMQPVTDARFLEFADAVDMTKDDILEIRDDLSAATRELWKELVRSVENVDAGDGDFRELIESDEIDQVMEAMMQVLVIPTAGSGVRKLGATVTVKTTAFFGGRLLTQTHRLKRKTDELRKKYDQLFQADDAGKPKLTQSERILAKAKLYDEISTGTEGFAKGKVPVRFKSVVVDNYFRPAIDPKR